MADALRIAIVGAESTGKTALAQAPAKTRAQVTAECDAAKQANP